MGILRAPVTAALIAALALSGCGGSSDTSKVKQTLSRAFRALATGDGPTLCSLTTTAGQATLAAAAPHSSCVKVVQLVAKHLTPSQKAAFESLKIGKVTIKGDRAAVPDSSLSSSRGSLKGFIQPGSAPTMLTRQSDGSWKISG